MIERRAEPEPDAAPERERPKRAAASRREDPGDLLPQNEAARIAGVSVSTIARLRRERRIATWRRGARVLVSRAEVADAVGVRLVRARPGDH